MRIYFVWQTLKFGYHLFEDARQLANDGILLDTQNRLPRLVEKWKKWLNRIAEASGGQ